MAVARVRLADLRCSEGVATPEFVAAVGVAAGSLTATGAVVLVADDSTADAVHTTLAAAAVLFAAPAADKRRYAATSDACGATGYRALSGKQVYDWRLNDLAGRPPTPDVVARAAPRAYARLSAAGRAVLAALSWSRLAGGGAEPPVDLGALCEPAPLPPQRQGASLLSLFRYEAGGGDAAPHVDRGLLTLVASTDAGLELRDAADETRWVPLTLQHGDVAVLVGATLAAATGQRLRAATHRVVAQQTPRSSVVLRLRGAPQALLPRISVAEFERTFDQAHVSVNRDGGGAGGIRTRGVEPVAVVGSVDLTSGRRPDDPASKRRRSVRQPEPAKVDQAIEIINIKIRDLDGNFVVHFKVRPGTKFEKMFDAYCTKNSLARDHMRYIFDGNRIQGSQTPAELEMEDGDTIVAMMEQRGD